MIGRDVAWDIRHPTPETTLDWASLYRSLELVVIPAIYGKKNPPINWKRYQKQKPTDEEFNHWFNDGRLHNIAIVCGQISRNFTALDFDDKCVYEKFFDLSKLEKEFPVVQTGSEEVHFQVWARTPKPQRSFKIPKLHLEIRSDGNIIIVPPSQHPSGRYYRFINDVRDIPVVRDLEEIIWKTAEAKFGVRKPSFSFGESLGPRARRGGSNPYRGRHPPCIKKLLEGVDQGFRNEAVARLASYYLFVKDLEPSRVQNILTRWNELNRPPLPSYEVRSVFRSVYHRGYVYGCQGFEAFCDRESCPFAERERKRFEREVGAL